MKSKINLIGITSLFLSTSFLINAQQNSAVAQITATPNDAGTVVNQNGNELKIQGGTEAGNNLFHSFDKFGVNKEQTANFISKPEIKNILGRVEGGDASVINGLIQVTGGNSNLYLMNPAGIIFGQGSSLDIPGAFTATTANGIGFGDKWFNALGTNDYAGLLEEPDSFAFTNPADAIGVDGFGAIAVDGFGDLAVKSGQNLTLVGGTVVSNKRLNAAAGNIAVVTVSEKKIVRITQPGNILSLETQPITESSNLPNDWTLPIKSLPALLTDGGVTDATGLTINGDEVELTGSGLKIENGDLVVDSVFAKNATLSSSRNLISVDRLTTSGNLNLIAQETVNLSDSFNPEQFLILRTGGNLKVKGDKINIQLDNENSVFQTGGNLDLISDKTITGNARFVTGGNFSVKNSSGGDGNFESDFLSDEGTNRKGIISSNGDVNFGSYKGSSLKIEAKGDINVDGDITITQPNASLVGTDPDIPILKNNSSLILRAGLSELKNPVSNSPTSVDRTSFENTDISTSPGDITVNGNITIEPSKENEVLGPTILSAKNNINVNGNISLGNFGGDDRFNKIVNSPLTLKALEGSISVTGDINAGDTIINSQKNINIENLETRAIYDTLGVGLTASRSDLVFLSSETGEITVNTINATFGNIIVDSAGAFRAKGTFSNTFTSGGPSKVPVSILARDIINIQHGGIKFTDGIGVEKDEKGNIIWVKDDGTRVFTKASEEFRPKVIFVDENGKTVPEEERPITVNSINFDIDNVSPDESFSAGLIVKSDGSDEALYDVFGDTFLDKSSDINSVSVPKPQPPETPETSEPDTSNEDGEVVQRQLNKEEQSALCSPQKSTIAANTTENNRGENTTNNSQSTKDDPCRTIENNNNTLEIIEDNRTNSNSALPTFLFRQGKK